MFLRTCILFAAAATSSGFEYDESAATLDIWVNQALDCPGSQGADLSNWDCGLACSQAPLSDVHVLQDVLLDTFGIVALQGDQCLLALRGTKSVMNMILDAGVLTKNPWGQDCPKCNVHAGFYNAWLSLSKQAQEALSAMGCDQKTLRVTGHSLGGSMAALAAFELSQSYSISGVYTYGQPRTGNSEWVAAFSKRFVGVPYFRVTQYQDPIPHYPLPNMFLQGYEHQLPEVYYDSTQPGAYTICTELDSLDCSSQWYIITVKDQGCFHCAYMGLNPCGCGNPEPECRHESESMV